MPPRNFRLRSKLFSHTPCTRDVDQRVASHFCEHKNAISVCFEQQVTQNNKLTSQEAEIYSIIKAPEVPGLGEEREAKEAFCISPEGLDMCRIVLESSLQKLHPLSVCTQTCKKHVLDTTKMLKN